MWRIFRTTTLKVTGFDFRSVQKLFLMKHSLNLSLTGEVLTEHQAEKRARSQLGHTDKKKEDVMTRHDGARAELS